MSSIDLSIVIPAKTSQAELDKILKDLKANKPDDTWELIIVNDGSETKLDLGDTPPSNWMILETKKNEGPARARNLGASVAQGKYIVFLSVFLSLPTDYITKTRSFIDKNRFHYAQHKIERAPGIKVTHFQEFVSNHKNRVNYKLKSPPIKQSLFGAAIIKHDIFEKLNGFDKAMQHYGGHEMELIYRMDKAGYNKRIYIDEFPLLRTKVEDHEHIRTRLKEYGRTGLPNLLAKHPELKSQLLKAELVWKILFSYGLGKFIENKTKNSVDKDRPLPNLIYRIYLHLIVRNAWDAR